MEAAPAHIVPTPHFFQLSRRDDTTASFHGVVTLVARRSRLSIRHPPSAIRHPPSAIRH
jgi:hypothetical protein